MRTYSASHMVAMLDLLKASYQQHVRDVAEDTAWKQMANQLRSIPGALRWRNDDPIKASIAEVRLVIGTPEEYAAALRYAAQRGPR